MHACDHPSEHAHSAVREQVFCTPSMASFLRNNQPWAQLAQRSNITINELDMGPTGSSSSSAKAVRLTPSISFVPVLVPHRAELSDTVAYVVSVSSQQAVHAGEKQTMNVLYCPDTDGWGDWPRSIRSWCEEVDVALLDATFYSKEELKGRDMKEVMWRQAILSQTFGDLFRRRLPSTRFQIARCCLHYQSDAETYFILTV